MGELSKILPAVLIVLLIYTPFAFSMDTPVTILGDAVGSGSAEMKTSFDKWISVAGKPYPISDGSNLRSGEGRITVTMKDGVKMEVRKNSNIIINGSRGNYAIRLLSGSIGFMVPQGISFSVATPTSTVKVQTGTGPVQKTSFISKDNTRGVVIFDGKGTSVLSIVGTLMVEDATGKGMLMLPSGNSLYVDEMGISSASRVIPVQLAEEENDSRKLLAIIGIAGAGIAAAGFLVSGGGGGGGDEEPVSPKAP